MTDPRPSLTPQAELTELRAKEKQLHTEMPTLVEKLHGNGCVGEGEDGGEDGVEVPADPEAGGGRQEGEAEEEEKKGGEDADEEVEKEALGGDADGSGSGSRRRTIKSVKERVDDITQSVDKKPLKERVDLLAQRAGKMKHRIT